MQGNPVNIDGDQLTKWIFGLAQIFGHWPYTNRINSHNQLDKIRFTICDRLRLTITCVFYLICAWIQNESYYMLMLNQSTIRRIVGMLIFMFHVVCTVSNYPITIYNRRNLLKILSINREFDIHVSISMKF